MFEEIIGQNKLVESLKYMVMTNNPVNTNLFSGPSGIGKKTIARLYAKALFCKAAEKNGDVSCSCSSCRMFRAGSHPDYTEIISDDDESLLVDDIRNIVQSIHIRPLYSEYKYVLISDSGNMTTQAQNCLLKILEEPPPYAVFILAASNADMLLPTIRSRAVRFEFRRNTDREVQHYLNSSKKLNEEELKFIVAYSGGIIGKAIRLTDSESAVSVRNEMFKVLYGMAGGKYKSYLEPSKYVIENKTYWTFICDIMFSFFRDLIIICNTDNTSMLFNADKAEMVAQSSKKRKVEVWSTCIEILEHTVKNMHYNTNYELSIDAMFINLMDIIQKA